MARRALSATVELARPFRTCVGCRKRVPASELLRVVAIEQGADAFSLVPDPARRRLGRGAHVHPDPACLALAERRRAFGRALRVTGVLDTGPLVETVCATPIRSDSPMVGASRPTRTSKVGRPT
ncbi:YlxR family protein [Planosporangium thailandense]|uniref:YlxR family protein n=1 Tax=Planosporangium thailandense TaxID=765197 RepID=A0ABX0XQN9_9ACTN|nr:YlxR family protein [Planosporangium thailandense]